MSNLPPDLQTIQDQILAATARRKAAEETRAAAAEDPAVQLAAAKLELAREQLAAEVAEHEVKADQIYREACGVHGFDGVIRVPTVLGSIVLRAQKEEEANVMLQSRDAHRRGAGPTPAEKALAEKNADEAMNRGLRATALTDSGHFDKVVARYHGIWNDLWAARNRLIDGRVRDEGKGDAR